MSLNRVLGAIGAIGVLSSFAVACGDDESSGGKGGSSGNTTTATSSSQTGTGGAGGGTTGITIPGQSAEVKAEVDPNGLLHLSGANDEDCFAALGYFHAKNRMFFMDFIRNLVRGSLGSLVKAGPVVLDRDFENRRWFATTDGTPLEEKLFADASPEVKSYLEAYTRGVNAWLGDMRAGKNGATLTTEYDFALIVKDAIRDWEPADSAAIGLYVLNDLSNNSGDELSLGQTLPAFPADLAADMFSPKPVFEAFTAPATPPPISIFGNHGHKANPAANGGFPTKLGAARSLLADAGQRMSLVGSGALNGPTGDTGSNNWVVAPNRTAGGAALLANDPHLPLTNPSIWFPVEIDAKSNGTGKYHMAGGTFPGLPSVMIGRNESIAWGVTTAYWDLADVYLEELSADNQSVMFNGAPVQIVEKEFTFKNAATNVDEKRTFRWVPHHGPIVSEDLTAHTAVSIRWRGHDGGTDLDAFFSMGKAANIAEGKASAELASSASQNFVVIDKAGDIGWYPFSKIPNRPWASATVRPWLPLPGDGTAEWETFVPFASLPQLTNPPSGVIATANADMTGASADGDLLNDGQAALQAYFKADGTREQRILDMLADGANGHSLETMKTIQGDTFSLYGEFVVPAVLDAAMGATLNANEQAVIDALEAWQFTCPTGIDGNDPAGPDSADATATAESIGCTTFHTVYYSIVHEALKDEIAASGVPSDGSDLTFVARALKDPASITSGELLWDDVSTTPAVETRTDIILRAVALAANRLAVTGAPNTWRWGRFHTLSLRSIFDNFGVTDYNAPAVAAPGGLFTVNVASPRRTIPADAQPWQLEYANGASLRVVMEAKADGLTMQFQLPGGSDLHRESPFYNNLLPNYLENKAIDFPFGPGAVPTPAESYDVKPR